MTAAEKKKLGKPFSVYLEPDVLQKLKDEAEKQKRSVTAQISFIIENYLEGKGDRCK